ncbi:hypothetical protein A3K72_03630 [Candidatus Woesearchaeota archaeon RBG_13_36_6]|nr:MAG: hypothetical protein A3K72_03630 [Candidatus Woesearchaeota archaeon RBG_13_36_6]
MAKLKQALENRLNREELSKLIRSFDIIGNIAIIGIPEELKPKQYIIAKAVLDSNKNIKTVLKKADIHKGEFRIQKLSYLVGKRTKETIYKENNVQLKLNVEKVYFTPRLSTERKRIYQLVKAGEEVLVMFSGVAPFCIVIAKNSKLRIVYGIEINPNAHKYALENVKLNKLGDKIRLYKGDVRKVVPNLKKRFDRILMPLPKTGEDFLDIALKASKKGTTIHFYDFSQEKDFPEQSIGKIEGACKKARKKFKVLHSTKCGAYAPYVYRVCIDFQII